MRYSFTHVLLRDAAYNVQLGARLRELHRKAAQAVEELHAGDLSPYYAGLAFHYRQAQDTQRELCYALLAGEQAVQNSAYREALALFERALILLPAGGREQISPLIQMGKTLRYLGDYAEARRRLEAGLGLAQQHDDVTGCIQALCHLGRIAADQGDLAQARLQLDESLRLSIQSGDPPQIAQALIQLSWVDFLQGAYADAQARLLESRDICRSTGDRLGLADALNVLGAVAMMLGNYAESRDLYMESLSLYQALGNRRGASGALNNLGETARAQHDYPAAQRYYQEALAVAREIGDQLSTALRLDNLGHTAAALGDYTAALDYYCKGLQVAASIGAVSHVLDLVAGLAGALARLGQTQQAFELLRLVSRHPAVDSEVQVTLETALTWLRGRFSPEIVEAALAQDAARTLEEAVADILSARDTAPARQGAGK